jgi:glycogen debranching enzyme
VHGRSADACAEARTRFLDPLYAHLDHAGLDHLSEIADGDAPHTPAGTPFQAWSLGELLRIERLLARLEPMSA